MRTCAGPAAESELHGASDFPGCAAEDCGDTRRIPGRAAFQARLHRGVLPPRLYGTAPEGVPALRSEGCASTSSARSAARRSRPICATSARPMTGSCLPEFPVPGCHVRDAGHPPRQLFDPQMYGGGTHENLPGQEAGPACGFQLRPGPQRPPRVNLLVYLNPEWDESWGGAIQLHSDPRDWEHDEVKTFNCTFNRCVVFETNEYPGTVSGASLRRQISAA